MLSSLCSVFKGTMAKDRKSTRLNSSHGYISYAVFCLKKKKKQKYNSIKHLIQHKTQNIQSSSTQIYLTYKKTNLQLNQAAISILSTSQSKDQTLTTTL